MNHFKLINFQFFCSVAVILFLQLFNTSHSFAQTNSDDHEIYFISDVQAPLLAEKMISKYYRNEEARDSLFSDIVRHHPEYLFMLGDLTSMGSNKKAWEPLDTFLISIHKINTKVYAIPGNHEYLMNSKRGIKMFVKRFPKLWLYGYFIKVDSIAVVMLNSNFSDLTKKDLSKQLLWYRKTMKSLDNDPNIKSIIVCTHHAPYSNSVIVGSSKPVADSIVPEFEHSRKGRLFISGHSHNLEYFVDSIGKHFLVIGGGGGIAQPLNSRLHHDLLTQDDKPLYFYLVVERKGNWLKLTARGFKKDFKMFEFVIGEINLN
jgi:Icc-related predicted phosphoesterase